jgi:hypothetical protein
LHRRARHGFANFPAEITNTKKGKIMAHNQMKRKSSSETDYRSGADGKSAISASALNNSSSSQNPEDGSSVPSWQPMLVIGAIILGLLFLVAKVAGVL